MAAHSSILAWKIPLMEDPGRLQSIVLSISSLHRILERVRLWGHFMDENTSSQETQAAPIPCFPSTFPWLDVWWGPHSVIPTQHSLCLFCFISPAKSYAVPHLDAWRSLLTLTFLNQTWALDSLWTLYSLCARSPQWPDSLCVHLIICKMGREGMSGSFFNFNFSIGGNLIYNIFLVSATQVNQS